jgi:hypothetical protein
VTLWLIALLAITAGALLAWSALSGTGERTGAASVFSAAPADDAGAAPASKGGQSATRESTASRHARSEPAPALPPNDEPLSKTFSTLQALAHAGDVHAAKRLFNEAYQCHVARETARTLPRAAARMLKTDTSKLSPDELQQQEQTLAQIQDRLELARRSDACAGLTDEQLAIAPLVQQAALLGDTGARSCYVMGMMLYAGGLINHPEWLVDYRAHALTMANEQVEKGDWAMAALLENAYSQQMQYAPLAQITGEDPTKAYRYFRLLQLGKIREAPDDELAEFMQTLSASQIDEADAWAQDTFLHNFGGQPSPDASISPCEP